MVLVLKYLLPSLRYRCWSRVLLSGGCFPQPARWWKVAEDPIYHVSSCESNEWKMQSSIHPTIWQCRDEWMSCTWRGGSNVSWDTALWSMNSSVSFTSAFLVALDLTEWPKWTVLILSGAWIKGLNPNVHLLDLSRTVCGVFTMSSLQSRWYAGLRSTVS